MSRPAPTPKAAFTHAPPARANLWLGALQLFTWLIFHPSAWRSALQQAAPGLRPDFILLDLSRRHWQQRPLRRFLWQMGLLWPVSVGVTIGLVALVAGTPPASILPAMIISFAISLAAFWLGGLVVPLAPVAVAGSLMALASGLALAFIWRLAGSPPADFWGALHRSFGAGVTAGIAISLYPAAPQSRFRQTSSIILGVLIGLATITIAAVAGNLAAGSIRIYDIPYVVTHGLILSLGLGLALRARTGNWRHLGAFVLLGLLVSIIFSTTGTTETAQTEPDTLLALWAAVLGGLGYGLVQTAVFATEFAIPYLLADRVGGPWAGAVGGAVGGVLIFVGFDNASGNGPLWPNLPLGLLAMAVGFTVSRWRPWLSYPWQAAWGAFLLRQAENSPNPAVTLGKRAAFWDEQQRLPLFGLDEHLLLVREKQPEAGEAAVAFLSTTPQRWAAQQAEVELAARRLQNCREITAIANAHHFLSRDSFNEEDTAVTILESFNRCSRDTQAALAQGTIYHQRLALRHAEEQLADLTRALTLSSAPDARRFLPIAQNWRRALTQHLDDLVAISAQKQTINNPYIFGVPLSASHEMFVGRADVSRRIEQLLWDKQRPPLLLYGQRRMGKTSLLHNLERLLPDSIIPLFVDGQAIAGAVDYADFLYGLGRAMLKSARQQQFALPPLRRQMLTASPFISFNEWLDAVEETLSQRGKNLALLMLDEFEALAESLTKSRFDAVDFMNMLRHLIQHRPRLKVLLCGAHTLDEFQQWASYLVNVQVIQVSYLQEAEARRLIEQPVNEFALQYEPAASQHIVDLTRGHPHLVQLLCYELVEVKNEQPVAQRYLASPVDVETALERALRHGRFFFDDIARNQVDAQGLALLQFLARQPDGQFIEERDCAAFGGAKTIARLRQRDLIEPTERGYRFQIEMIRRWFRQSGNSR